TFISFYCLQLEIKLEKEASGKREMIFAHDICDLCKELVDRDSNYYKYFKHIDFPATPGGGGFQGDYPIHDFVLDADEIPLNSYNVGLYVATMNIYENPTGDCKANKEFLCSLHLGLSVEME
uniref:Uncharacterized protein n=1 Tax=Bombyx mori TaxID=7091 RepID=A0A8R2M969_BOMMO